MAADYALEGVKWGSGPFGSTGGNVTWAVDSSIPSFFVSVLSAAFADWSRYGNITFSQISSTASASIDFGLTYLDGRNNTLGVASYSYSGSTIISAAVTFDSAENWHNIGGTVVSDGGANLFIVALHEIGHAIGLDHYNSSPAVMNSVLNPSISELTQSDVHGVQAIYGAGYRAASDYFGMTTHSVQSAGGQVYALYDGLFDRAPDALGMQGWALALNSGMPLRDLAQALLQSSEGQSHLGAQGNAQFVEQLYQTALHRPGDAAGAQAWTDSLNQGASRADVALAFALGSENRASIQPALDSGVFVPDADASSVARLYYALFDRAPDAAGLSAWTQSVEHGTSLKFVSQSFLNSQEFAPRAGLSDAAFVDSLYEGALGRHADARGLQAWTASLEQGSSRADVAILIAQSPEAQQHLVANIEIGWQLS